MMKLNDSNVNDTISSATLTVVQLGASWCAPCKLLKPKVEKLALENPSITFAYVDIEESHSFTAKSQVMNVPTVIGYRNGVEVDRVVGNSEPSVKELIRKLLPTQEST